MNFDFTDRGKQPVVENIEEWTLANENYRTTVWTGSKMQMTLMTIQPGDDIGLEVHEGIDQFLRIEEGKGLCKMGDAEDNLTFVKEVSDDDAILFLLICGIMSKILVTNHLNFIHFTQVQIMYLVQFIQLIKMPLMILTNIN